MKPFTAFIRSLTIGLIFFAVMGLCSMGVFSFLGLLFGANLTIGACIIHTINKNSQELRKELKGLAQKDE